jgi:crotonobetainyl-CoA:carnitine CoA-transferase CaiB-like acyl-CoA transferase
VNPRAVLALITSFGIDDEESGAAGGDVVAQAESGLASFNGEPDGAPLIAQNAPADVAGAMYAAIALLAAYVEAQKTGVGRVIDLSLTDVYTTMDVGITPLVLATGGDFQPERTGRFHPSFTPHGVFRATGGHIVISAYGTGANSMWPRLAHALGRDDLAEAEGYRSDAERRQRRDEIVTLIEDWMATFESTDAAVRVLRDNGVIAATVRTPHETVTSARAIRRRLVRRVEHPVAGPMDVISLPLRIGGFEPAIGPAPLLGADTVDVLMDLLGYEQKRVDSLVESGAVMAKGT